MELLQLPEQKQELIQKQPLTQQRELKTTVLLSKKIQ